MASYKSTLVILQGKSQFFIKNNYLKLLCADNKTTAIKPYKILWLCSSALLPWSQECDYNAIYHRSG